MRPLKIAWCHHGDSGGSKRAAFEMVRELSRRGHLIDEFIIRDSPPNLEHFPMTAFVRRTSRIAIAPPRRGLRPYILETWWGVLDELARGPRIRAVFRGLAAEMHREDYDLVHVDQIAQCLATGLLPFLRIPAIVYSHEASLARYRNRSDNHRENHRGPISTAYTRVSEWGDAVSKRVRDRRDQRNARRAPLILTNSEYSRDVYVRRYRTNALVCPYGVDAETFRPLGMPPENLVLSVGRLVEPKQHHQVVHAIGRLSSPKKPRLVIATPELPDRLEDPSYLAMLRKSADETGICLEVVYNPPQEELVRLYGRAATVVFVPRMEPFGLVALEAMACGTPVIGVPEGGVLESVRDGVTGFLVPREPAAMAAKIDFLLTNREARAQMGSEAVSYVRKEWSWSRTIDRYENHAARLLESQGDSR